MTPRLAVFGLGYVGVVSAACFAARGHHVVGVDVNVDKVGMIQAGHPTIEEPEIADLVRTGVQSGRLRATDDAAQAVAESDIGLICVGTPSTATGGLSTDYLDRICDEIGAVLPGKRGHYTVVVRSTMLPGTGERLVERLEKASGMQRGRDFGFCVNPEFLREGSSVDDFWHPPKTVIGELDQASGAPVAALYEGLPGPVYRVSIPVAETIKYVDNAFHALKVSFANEIGTWSKALGLDSHEIMDIFRSDTKLNIAPTYLRPGYAFGGSCLPKDLRAMLHTARHADVEMPLIEHILESNAHQIRRVHDLIMSAGPRRVGIFGLSFKSGTDDLRESPMVTLAEQLLGRGIELLIYDRQVATSRLHGANRAYVEERIPHLGRLLSSSPDAVATHAEVCVLGTTAPEAVEAIARAPDAIVIDLVRPPGHEALQRNGKYVGIAW
jgi:GDP-mannose 6-dehydrogenase